MRRTPHAIVLSLVVLLTACSSESATSNAVLPTRTVDSGEVGLEITPTKFDATGAVLHITMDTHSVELSMDLANGAVLEVGGTRWSKPSWNGDGPGGHHRVGELQFDAAGPARGTARLTLTGFPAPVDVTWELAGT